MASTYSDLKIELIGTGDQSGTWGITTNSNLGNDGLGAAIAGSADVTFSSADVTLTLTDTVAAQSARNLRLNLTGTTGGARNLILGSGCQIEKPYLINNGTADTITVKNTSGTGIAVPAGKSMWVYNNGTNVVDAVTHLTSLTLGSALPIASGGTGSTSTTFVNLATNVTGDLPFSNLAQGSALSVLGVTGNATADVASIAAGTDNQVLRRSGTSVAFGAVNLASTDAVTGTLPVGNGGTGATTLTANNVIIGNGTSAVQFVAPGSSGNVLTSNGTTWTSAAGAAGDVTAAGNNAFTGANTFYNATGQTFAPASTNDGIIVLGRAGGSSSYRVTLAPTTLSASRTLTLPDATDTVAVLGTAQTFTALQTFSGSATSAATKLTNAKEVATVSATAATGTITYNVTTQSVLYYTTNASANWTVNFTVSWNGSTGTKLDDIMSTGESMTVAFLVTQGATAYYNSTVQVDGSSVTPKYQGGTAWSAGNASSIDAYVYTIVKTGAATFTVFASQTRFA